MNERWAGTLIEGSRCPKCNGELEYGGNYWCSDRNGCGWVLPDYAEMNFNDKKAFNVAYTLLMKQNGREPHASALLHEAL